MAEAPTFVDDHHLRVGGTHFYCKFPLADVPAGHLPVMKPRDLVERYIDLCRSLRPERIIELGIRRGGCTALLAELATPERLVAVEIAREPAPALTRYIEERGRADVVRPHYGVDQADRRQLAQIVAEEFGGAALDLVVDDASHLLDPSRSSFETLFPWLRPGGLYVIEDWSHQHHRVDGIAAALRNPTDEMLAMLEERLQEPAAEPLTVPLSRLAIELLLVRASSGAAVEEITVGSHWVLVRRGPAELDPKAFRMSDLIDDYFHLLS